MSYSNSQVAGMNDQAIYDAMIAPHGGSIKSAYGMRMKAKTAVEAGYGQADYQHRFRGGDSNTATSNSNPQAAKRVNALNIPLKPEFNAAMLLVSNLKKIEFSRATFKEAIEANNAEVIGLLQTMLGESFADFAKVLGVKTDQEKLDSLRAQIEQASIMVENLRTMGYTVTVPNWAFLAREPDMTFKQVCDARASEQQVYFDITTSLARLDLNEVPEIALDPIADMS